MAGLTPNTLTLLGTGLRYASDVRVKIGGREVTPKSVAPSDTAAGVDEVQVAVPLSARSGMNTISLLVNTTSSATTSPSAAPSGPTTLAASSTQSSATTQPSDAPAASNAVQAMVLSDAPAGPTTLTAADVQLIIAQAVAKAQQIGFLATIAVLDQEGNVLGVFKMNGARSDVRLGGINLAGQPTAAPDPNGLDGVTLPLAPGLGIFSDGAALAAMSKAGTAAFFSTQGSAISTRTASAIVQENFPVGISSQAGGPLFGVQFSSLPCSDTRNPLVNQLPNLPIGLSADSGGLPIYKNGLAVGGIGVEGNGLYTFDASIMDLDRTPEEDIAAAGIKGFRVAKVFQADNILIDGMRLAFSNVPLSAADGPAPAPFGSLPGTVIFPLDMTTNPPTPVIRGQQISGFTPLTLGGVPGRVIPDPSPGVNLAGGVRKGFFPFVGSTVSSLTAADVNTILTQAAQQAYRMRAAIRIGPSAGLPAQPTEVNIAVVDTSGAVLGQFSTQDAPQFGQPVSIQKGRTALFFSLQNAGAQLLAANANVAGIVPGLDISRYVTAATKFGVPLNGQNAFSSRAMGFLARPFFPDGIPGTPNGPFSEPFGTWSVFNDGLQIALVKPALVRLLTGGTPPSGVAFNCSPLPNDLIFASGIQIFAGGAALFKNGVLVGAIGVSGDGIDQDDAVARAGAFGFDPPAAVTADQLLIGGVRLPYTKYPRHINISNLSPVAPIIRTSRVFANTN
jgi:uncharacterized protein GlcG (DUF336 family)